MLMEHPPLYQGHTVIPKTSDGPRPPVNMGAMGSTINRNIPNHASTPDYRLYPGPMHANQYHQHGALVPTFQHVIANWLKSGRLGR